MRLLLVLLILAGCAHPADVPSDLRTCPVPVPIPALRTTKTLADYGNRIEKAREDCAERLRRLNLWIGAHH